MADDRSSVGQQDRSRVAASEPCEVEYFARKHGLTQPQARDIVDKEGPDRKTCDRAVRRQDA